LPPNLIQTARPADAQDHLLISCATPICDLGGQGGGSAERVWVSADYLLWWVRHDHVPPLVTISPPGFSGVLPGAGVLIGGSDLDRDVFSGFRMDLGFWLNERRSLALETDFFFLGRGSQELAVGGPNPSPPVSIWRPVATQFIPVGNPRPDAIPLSAPGPSLGALTASESSRQWGIEENVVTRVSACGTHCLDCFAGLRFVALDEGLRINDYRYLPFSPTIEPLSAITDEFGIHNRFYGGQIGVRTEYSWGRLFANAKAALALGDSAETVRINGTTAFTPVGQAVVAQSGGILATPSNIGRYDRNVLSFIPEVGFNLGYQVTPHLRAHLGYTLLYWSDVVRPGEQVDLVINPTQPTMIPPTLNRPTPQGTRPAALFRTADFWDQGMNFGLEFRF
jgi:hypothetical protein